MLKAWTILVLCGLLPCSHGVAENVLSVAQLDKAVLENILSDTLANGNLLQGLLGGSPLGGDLLGGLTKGILGGQGGGPLDGVLGGQAGGLLGGNILRGLTEGVLGQGGGPLDGVLGGQGSGPLGGDLIGGLTEGVLGGQGGGLLGGVLGQGGGPLGGDLIGGLTEGVLGGQGGGPLGGDLIGGLTEGVLGGQGGGLLGGVLGQGGGPLGGDLIGGLTEGVLGGQRGGLLGSLLGGRGGLLGLKIVDIVLPRVSLELLPGVGLGVNVYAKVAIQGNTVLSGLLNLMVEVNVTAKTLLVLQENGAPRLVVENCRTNLGGVQILSGFLPLSLDNVLSSVLNNVIPGVLCPVVDVVVNVVNILLGTVNSICPFGSLGKLHYTLAGLPLFSGQHIILNLNLMLLDPQGNTVALPAAQLPPLPLAANHTSQLLLSGNLLSSLLRLLAGRGGLNADITEQTLQGAVPLTTTALQSVLPEISQLLPADLPLVVKVRVSELPAVSLQDGKVTVTLTAATEVFARTRAGLRALFGVDASIVLSGQVSITATKLAITLSLQSIALKTSSSEIGSFDVAPLTDWFTDILRIGYLPVINGALTVGIPLPNLLNLNLADAAVTTAQDAFVVSVPPKRL